MALLPSSNSPIEWVRYLADNDATLVKRIGPPFVIIRRKKKDSGKLWFGGGTTRDYVVNLLLEQYGSVEAVNEEIIKIRETK